MFLVMVNPQGIDVKGYQRDNVRCFWTHLSSVAASGQQNLLLPMKAPDLVASTIPIISTEVGLSGVLLGCTCVSG